MASYNTVEMRYASSDGKNTVYSRIYMPACGKARAVVQLVHGMVDHIGRYTVLAEYLCARGYALAGNDHLGHGYTASSEDDLGFFASRGGADIVIEDVRLFNERLHAQFGNTPIFMLGHSMGSFIARLYACEHPRTIRGLIIHGTGGANPLVPLGRVLVRLLRIVRGDKHRSRTVSSMAFGSYNKRFPGEGVNAWLSRDGEMIASKLNDRYGSFTFTLAGYSDLFKLISRSNSRRFYREYPTSMPTLIVSGNMDPVGNYGKGVEQVYKKLCLGGRSRVELKLYDGARHELFNEINREEVFSDICDFLEGCGG